MRNIKNIIRRRKLKEQLKWTIDKFSVIENGLLVKVHIIVVTTNLSMYLFKLIFYNKPYFRLFTFVLIILMR